MDSYTRGIVSISSPREEVFQQVKETCKEIKGKIKEIDEHNYSIIGKRPTTWKRFGEEYKIILRNENLVTIVEVYHNELGLKLGPFKDFIDIFFKALAKHIPLQSGIKYDVINVKQINMQTEMQLK